MNYARKDEAGKETRIERKDRNPIISRKMTKPELGVKTKKKKAITMMILTATKFITRIRKTKTKYNSVKEFVSFAS